MFDDYFTYWDELADGSGFSAWSAPHVIWLAILSTLVGAGTFIYIKRDRRGRKAIRRLTAAVMVAMEVYKDAALVLGGNMQVQYLPLQLCGMAIIVEAVFAFLPDSDGKWVRAVRKFLGEVMCILCLPGAAAALLFPDWLRYPVINFMSLHSFILHGLLVLMPMMCLAAGDVRPDIRRIYMIFGFLAGAATLVYPVNRAFDSNFLFLGWPSNDSPFEKIYLEHGTGGYLAVYGAAVVCGVLFMYVVIYVIRKLPRYNGIKM